MQEFLKIGWDPALKGSRKELGKVVRAWKERGYRIQPMWGEGCSTQEMLVPPGDTSWRVEMKEAVKRGLIDEDWTADESEYVYSEEDFRAAPYMCPSHVGRCLSYAARGDRAPSVSHFGRFDASVACPKCHVGVVQEGSLRFPAAELNRAGKMASVNIGGTDFLMISGMVADALEAECGERLPLREVECYGKAKAKERWWQIFPESALPESLITLYGYNIKHCPACGAPKRGAPQSDLVTISAWAVEGKGLRRIRSATAVYCPIYSNTMLNLAPDGQVRSFPIQDLWLRGDVCRALQKMRIRGLDFIPILLK